jgi:D-glycero-D-manno-heptose 1,7-bisphosphate phosphatase
MTRDPGSRRRFVLLDRDGTIIVERYYLSDPDWVELLPGAAEGLRRLSRLGLGLVVVTNQSGVGRGYFDERRLAEIHRRFAGVLEAEGVRLDNIYYCPHTPEDGCRCRKPETAMVERAAAELGLDPAEAFLVGDQASDIELGRRVGATSFLVRTGFGAETAAAGESGGFEVVEDLGEAARRIEELLSSVTSRRPR